MPLLINQQLVTDDPWQLLDHATLEHNPQLPANGPVAVPFVWYQQHRDALLRRDNLLGVMVNGDDDLTALYTDHSQFTLIAIEFPVFRDGRGFSIARQLVRHGFRQQIRAIGDVTRDRLALMQSSGFTAFAINDEGFDTAHLQAFAEISVNYQGTTADPRPIFRR